MNACSHGSIFVCFSLGTAFPCCQCRVSAVPQYHLAMVDGTIRNFCSYDCVSIYRVPLFFLSNSSWWWRSVGLNVAVDVTLLLFSVHIFTEVWKHISARPDQWNLDSQGILPQRCSQTRSLCWSQLGPSRPSGVLIVSPLPGSPPQSYLSAPIGATLPSHVLPLCPRANPSQSTCWSASETSRGWAEWHVQANLPPVQQTVRHQATAIKSPSKELSSRAHTDTQP